MSKEKNFTTSIKCGHCQNQAPMEVVADYSTVKEYSARQTIVIWDAGSVY